MQKPKYKDAKLNEFAERVHSIPVKNLKRLIGLYKDELSRLMEYCLVLEEEVARRESLTYEE